jgi:hypothetical protein
VGILFFSKASINLGNTLAAELSAANARVFRAAWQLATAPIAKKIDLSSYKCKDLSGFQKLTGLKLNLGLMSKIDTQLINVFYF